MSDIYHLLIATIGSGLCNQLYAIITGIIFAYSLHKRRVVIEHFRDDYSNIYKHTPISEILDLDETNRGIESLHLTLVDGILNPTDEILYNAMCCPTWANQNVFDFILRSIRFHSSFISIAKAFTDKIEPGARINAIHLRIEDDAISSLCATSGANKDEFRKALADRYIDIITKHVEKTDVNLILSYSTDNAVLDFMKNNGYRFMCTEKDFSMGREKNAIVDTLVAQSCNNVMIANMSIEDSIGSSFSYFVAKRLMDNVKCVMLDLRDLSIPDVVRMTPL
jgi:hypothetical protein